MRLFATFAIVLSLCALLSACGSSSPKRVLASIVAAALSHKSAHVSVVEPDNTGTLTTVVDVTRDSGAGRITGSLGPYAVDAEIRFVHNTVYVNGNTYALELLLFALPRASRYAGKWISVPRGDEGYVHLSRLLALATIVQDATPQRGKLKVLTRTSHGTRFLDVHGTLPHSEGASDLTARASGEPLPVTSSYSTSTGIARTVRFSKWSEPVHVQAPSSSTPVATVRS